MIKLTGYPGAPGAGSSLWFVVPNELQKAMGAMLGSKLADIRDARERARAEKVLYEVGNCTDEKYSNTIWDAHGLSFYASYGVWRVGCKAVPKGVTQDSVLAEIRKYVVVVESNEICK